MADSLLEQGIEAARTGQHERARVLLAQVLQKEPNSDQAWLWLSAAVEDDRQKLYCLRRAQRINPNRAAVAQAIRSLSARLEAVQEVPLRAVPFEGADEPLGAAPAAQEQEEGRAEAPAPARPHWRGTLLSVGVLVLQRLFLGVLVLLAISYLSYLGLDMAAGTALQVALPRAARKMSVYLGQLLQGHLGATFAGSATLVQQPIAQVLPDVLSKSLGLLGVSLTVATLIGVLLGIWAAKRRHTGWSLITLLASISGVSIPSFFAALLLQLAAIRWTRTFGHALLPVGGFGWDERIILPALVLAARPVAQIARVTFVSIGEVLDQDFVRTAQSKGLSLRQVMNRHVVRNAAIPILTTVGLSLRFSLSSLPVVEFFFNWTGVGFTLLKAIARRDDNLTTLLLLCLGALFVLINIVLEVVYRLIDPRLRDRASGSEQQERESLLDILRSVVASLRDWLARLPLWRWPGRRGASAVPSPFRSLLERRGIEVNVDAPEHLAERRRSWIRGTVSNVPFVIGGLLVALLIGAVLFGPGLSPYSPYTTRGLEYKDGQLTVPPFAPGDAYPWGTDPLGRDIMSLVLSGAQQTLLLVALVVSVRIVLGIVLGALAGWLNGSWVDRLLLGTAEVIAAFPTLLLAMTLILALGIRQGIRPFVIALSFVGWAEIMQFVRGEVMTIRLRPFIESAVATGLRTPRMILSHVLPNLLSSLISIAALEMGSVLMLLGELGFVGIFIGGGAFAELQVDAAPYHYSDVPEWGALLSNIRLYARAYPWTAIYPAMAFFVAILGFNLFGEGIRRMVETVGVGFTRLVNRYTVALALLVALGVGWAKGNTGATAFYRQQAAAFDGQHALAYAESLADPALDGRALGTPGLEAAGAQIAQQFAALGLQPGGEALGYFQKRDRSCEILDAVPRLSVEGQETSWVYRQDYAEYAGDQRNLGEFTGPVRIFASGELTQIRTIGGYFYKGLENLDLSNNVVMVLSDREAFYLERMGLGGLLVVAGDESDLQRRYTLSSRDANWRAWGAARAVGRDTPSLWITEAVADRLLEGTGYTVADLRQQVEQLKQDQVLDLPTSVSASLQVQGTIQDKIPVRHVIGHMPGLADSRYGGINNQAIVVLAQYDSPPPSPDGAAYPAANDNASGVAVMMEAVRAMQESGYQPYRTFLFIAYSGEGLEGGESVSPSDVRKFLQAHAGFVGSLDVKAIVHLRGVGAGEGNALTISASGSRHLADLFQQSARRMGVRAYAPKEPVDISIVFEDKSTSERGQEAPEIELSWEGWEANSRTPADTAAALSADNLEKTGRALTLALMVMGRELEY
jgi:ABC-type dipeptide/oligopeptide/nickel transport system permease component